ncbi:MAG: hypothetical protein JSV60_11430, partial [Desulfobacterales bacterium]
LGQIFKQGALHCSRFASFKNTSYLLLKTTYDSFKQISELSWSVKTIGWLAILQWGASLWIFFRTAYLYKLEHPSISFPLTPYSLSNIFDVSKTEPQKGADYPQFAAGLPSASKNGQLPHEPDISGFIESAGSLNWAASLYCH